MHTTTENHQKAHAAFYSLPPTDQAHRLHREAYAEVIDGEDAPTNADCATCGASHVFDTLADAEEWQIDHGDLGHRVEITTI